MIRVGINGLGRIGRALFKIILETPEMELIAVNDLVPPDNLAYLLNYDTVYGRYPIKIESYNNSLLVDRQVFPVYGHQNPGQIPWGELNVDTVFECTGVFTKTEDLRKHLQAGCKRVILSAPAKSPDIPTIVYGINHRRTQSLEMVSCASCTTNCISPIIEIVGRRIGIKKALMTTIHAYTASQGIVDGPAARFRRGRAAAVNLVPTSTGAAIATTKVLPHYKELFDGVAVRAPVPVGSIADITLVTERPTDVDEVNNVFREEIRSEWYEGVLDISEDPIVSADITKNPHASIVDLTMTQVVDGDLVKIMSWYDNEWGYANQMVRLALEMGKSIETPEPIAEREIDEPVL